MAHLPSIWVAFRLLADQSVFVQWTTFAALMVVLPVVAYHAIEAPFIQFGNSLGKVLGRERAPLSTATVSQV